jgi:hypothetical protein
VAISNKQHPNEYTLARVSHLPVTASSGAMYPLVPIIVIGALESSNRAKPKSANFGSP